ncbi:sulfatase-like hydrolase/transferase [candidate division KSB1 bacterium]|nr:sulfatase-like hydrolase/transferase [candidate division KSB1 bacterium]MBL7094130.1 sulfatase-like hydrolase/transferase [candidate division KSB1 bacterium]
MQTTGLVAASTLLALNYKCSSTKSRPNILWITAEDISHDLGCYGDPVAQTPNIDKLASKGVRYTNAYSVSGVCAPSRSALISGMYPVSIGTHHMRTKTHDFPGLPKPYHAVVPPYVKGYPEYLRAAGYYCTNRKKTDYQIGNPISIWDECSNKAHWRNRAPGQPFFAVINFNITHESKIRTPLNKKAITDPSKIKIPPYYPDTPIVRNDWARYYDNIATMDTQVGELLKQLEDDGLAENTIVFFYGDHGRGLPRAKRWIYDSGIKVPLIICFPDMRNAGVVNDNLVSFVDFGPTVLSIAGVKVPEHIQGQPFLGSQKKAPRKYIYAARDRMDERYDMIRAVRDKKFKYIRNFQPEKPYAQEIPYMEKMPTMQEMRRLHKEGKLHGSEKLYFRETKPVEELYDCLIDPHEVSNLAENPKYKDKLERMRVELKKWMDDINDMGFIPETEMVEKMWPGGKQPVTAKPNIEIDGKKKIFKISCDTEGASIVYTTEDGENPHWLLYSEPVKLKNKYSIRAKAIRYGYKHSEEAATNFILG